MKENIRIRNRSGVCSIDIEGTIGVRSVAVRRSGGAGGHLRRVPRGRAAHRPGGGGRSGGEHPLDGRRRERRAAHIRRPEGARRAHRDALLLRIHGVGGHDHRPRRRRRAHARCRPMRSTWYTRPRAPRRGNAEELAARIDLLRRTDERLAALYAARSGRTAEGVRAADGRNNGAGRWLSPEGGGGGRSGRCGDGCGVRGCGGANIVRGWEGLRRAHRGTRRPPAGERPQHPALRRAAALGHRPARRAGAGRTHGHENPARTPRCTTCCTRRTNAPMRTMRGASPGSDPQGGDGGRFGHVRRMPGGNTTKMNKQLKNRRK